MTVRYPGNTAFVQARNYTTTPGANLKITRVVIHDMEMAEAGTTAESCAAMFAGAGSPQASAHFMVDSNSVIQGVDVDRVAWHAPPNRGSVGIEHAGRAAQTAAQWLDPYGVAMLTRSAALTAWLCKTFDVPVVKLSAADLLAGRHGITGHADVSAAWHQTDHTDPGPNFPWSWYLAQVKAHNAGGTTIMATLDKDDLTAIKAQVVDAVFNYPLAGINVQTVLSRTYQSAGRLEAAAALEAAETPDTIAAAVVARMGTGTGVGGSLTAADVQAAVVHVLTHGTAGA